MDKINTTRNSSTIKLNKHSLIDVISAEKVLSLVPMCSAIDLMERAFRSLQKGKCYVPLRSVSKSPDNKITLFFKPVFNSGGDKFAVKFLAQNNENRALGLPVITGVVLLMDSKTGQIVSIIDGDSVTAMRTGAVSGLATSLCARPDSKIMALFGCGAQGRTQIEAILSVRYIKKVYLYDINRDYADKLIDELQEKFDVTFEYTTDLNALKEVDVICTATGSRKPLFSHKHLKKGVHINAIGGYQPEMQEIDPEVVLKSRLIVDQKEACLKEPGDILIPIKSGLIKPDHIVGELSEVVCNMIPGRVSNEEVTLFKSVGLAVQDLYLSREAYNKNKLEEVKL